MAARIFAIVNIADVQGLVNAAGQAVISQSRHSLDGTRIVLDFNHDDKTIGSLFVEGTDVDAVIDNCQMLTHQQARDVMTTADWTDPTIELPR